MRFALIYGADEQFAAWAANRLEHVGAPGFGPCRAVAIATGDTAADRIWGVVVFHDYQPRAGTCQVSVASVSPLWAQPRALAELMAIPFGDKPDGWGCHKLWVAIPHSNERSLRFNRGIGMKQEAILRHHFGKGTHAVIMSMMRPAWAARWRMDDGQGNRRDTANAA